MGLYIEVKKVKVSEIELSSGFGSNSTIGMVIEDHPNFQFASFITPRAYEFYDSIKWIKSQAYRYTGDSETIEIVRPYKIDEAIKWVNENIDDGSDYLSALKQMESESNCVFTIT